LVQILVERNSADGSGLQGVLTIADLCGHEAHRPSAIAKSHVQQSLVSLRSCVVVQSSCLHLISVLACLILLHQLNFGRLVRARCTGEFVAASACLVTRLLFDSCGGNGRTVLIATISSLQKDLKFTLHTLHLARQAINTQDLPRYNYSDRKESPFSPKGKSRSGQSISLVHRFAKTVRMFLPTASHSADDTAVMLWKALIP
jgi:hypothetical protein